MSERHKSPLDRSSRSGSRHEGATLPEDSGDFSIETTTMRLKSLKLRRAEVAEKQISDAIKPVSSQPSGTPRGGPAGRVRHDERGVAVWDWSVATGEFCTLSTTIALKRLEVADLRIDDRDQAGGFDPYNQRGSGKKK